VRAVLESRDVSPFVVVHQVEDHLVHEVRGFGAGQRGPAEVQLCPVEDDELWRNLLEHAVGYLASDGAEPVLEDFLRRCGDYVAPGPVVVALWGMGLGLGEGSFWDDRRGGLVAYVFCVGVEHCGGLRGCVGVSLKLGGWVVTCLSNDGSCRLVIYHHVSPLGF